MDINLPSLEHMLVSEEFPAFAGSTCWIQGVYVYKELSGRNDDMAYYGITKDIENDGMFNGELCKSTEKLTGLRNEHCEPMKKTFYQQVRLINMWITYGFTDSCETIQNLY